MIEGIVWVYTSYSSIGTFVPCWELVERIADATSTSGTGFRDYYTGVLVFPDGRLLIGNRPSIIDCDLVGAAKELGRTTYLLMRGG